MSSPTNFATPSPTSTPAPPVLRERRASGVADKENTVLLCAYIGIGGEQEPHLLDIQDKNFASARQLYIPYSDKRKYFELQLQMFYACGIDVGSFPSGRIRCVKLKLNSTLIMAAAIVYFMKRNS
ncbi:hypothetical protein PRIPAC_76397 [Pristionchus pacificus]|uniref:LAG1_DNAbind domain-containing protein n=1 Tax=Pristionchus pacificus TaxID=54126 RepID=A0A2A6BZC6_PRIPA|nr:hypothetical protein PRIPAC_76397 [Pristionchus pacificus]|eukprot:PDM71294.1 hypothetical protein PRIPAC_37701 [Pristionchus pacificus]